MKYFCIIAIFFSTFLSCSSKNETINGRWKLELELQDKILPVMIDLNETSNLLSGTLYNGNEKVPLVGKVDQQNFSLEIGPSYGVFMGHFQNGKMSGHWVKTNQKNYRVSFRGARDRSNQLFSHYEKEKNFLDISGNWKVDLGDNNFGIAHFLQIGSRVQGSIVTDTGDYRFLDGHIEKDRLKLYGFDGGFAFIIELLFEDKVFTGMLHWGRTYKQKITGVYDPNFTLWSSPRKVDSKLSNI